MNRTLVFISTAVLCFIVTSHHAFAAANAYICGYCLDSKGMKYKEMYSFDLDRREISLFCKIDSANGPFKAKPSPAGDLVAMTNIAGTLYFYSNDGKRVKEINTGNHGMDWSPDGKRYVYTTGKGETDFVESTGTWIHDMKTGKETKIFEGGVFVYWSRFNNKIYIGEHVEALSVVAYNLAAGKIEKTKYTDIAFSPDGKYYVTLDWGTMESIMLINCETGEDIAQKYKVLAPEYKLYLAEAVQWPRPNIMTIVDARDTPKTYILYLDTGRTLVVERYLAMSEDGKKVYTASADLKKVEEKNIEDVQVVFSEKDGMVKK